mgnify:CR=1 FL=1
MSLGIHIIFFCMVLQPIMHGFLSSLLAASQQFKQKKSQFIVWKMSIFCNLFVWKMSIFDVLFVWIILFQLSL